MMHNYEPKLSQDIDYYKLTMGDMIYARQPDAEVTFSLINRNADQPLARYVDVDSLTERLDALRQTGFTTEEIGYFAGLQAQDGKARFTPEYLDHIAELHLPEVSVTINPTTEDLAIRTTGPWADVSLWETVVMTQANELYNMNRIKEGGLNVDDIYAEGDRRLTDKIATVQARPDISFSDFGTRRRFSAKWQEHVIERLVNEVPTSFTGTSNPWFAYTHDLQPIGTYAHELPMVYAGLKDELGCNPMTGHTQMMTDWEQHYPNDLSIALTDTFGSDMFFADFTQKQAERWTGLRHDSGNPFEFGERAIDVYTEHGIDPSTKTIVFSDGLDLDTIVELADYFKHKINVTFGWGTTLMNDLGLSANNIVMKATHVTHTSMHGVDLTKLSDDEGKHTGPAEKVRQYQNAAAAFIGSHAVRHMIAIA